MRRSEMSWNSRSRCIKIMGALQHKRPSKLSYSAFGKQSAKLYGRNLKKKKEKLYRAQCSASRARTFFWTWGVHQGSHPLYRKQPARPGDLLVALTSQFCNKVV